MENQQEAAVSSPAAAKTKLTPASTMLEDAWRDYVKNFKKFIGVYIYGLAGFIPFAIVALIFLLASSYGSALDNYAFRILLVLLLALSGLWALYYAIRARAAMVLLIKTNYSSARENFESSKKYFWAYVWVSIISSVIIGLWSLLLIIPGIIFAIFYILVNYTFFFEDLKGMAALRRSKELVKDYWWAILGRTIFIGLIAGILNILLALPLASMTEGSAAYSIYNVFINLLWALISPIIIIYTYYMYRDLLAIKGESKLLKK